MLGFETLDPTTAYLPHNLTITSTNDIDIVSLKELQRGHFTLIDTNMGKNFEKNVSFYEPAPLDLYTKFSMQTYFLAFWIIIIRHVAKSKNLGGGAPAPPACNMPDYPTKLSDICC